MPWSEAVEIAGSETRLCAGARPRTGKWWKQRNSVPAYRLLPFLLERHRRQDGGGAEGNEEDPPDLAHLLANVRRIYASSNQDVLLALRQNLHVFLLTLRPRSRRPAVQRLGEILVGWKRVTGKDIDEAMDEQRRQAEKA